MKKIIKWLIGLLLLGGLGYGGWIVYNRYTSPQVSQAAASTPVKVVQLTTGSLDTTISAIGTVRSNQTAQVTWQASGKVGSIAVKEGDVVKAGDTLATLADNSVSSQIIQAKQDLVTAQQALSDLTSNQTDLAAAVVAVINDQAAVDKAQNHRDMMNSTTRGTEQQILDATIAYNRAQQNLDRARALYESLPGDPTTEVHNKAPALLMLEDAKTARNTALAVVNWYKGYWTKAEINAADEALAVARANLAEAQATLARLQSGPDATGLATIRKRIAADQATISTQAITAPISGTVTVVSDMPGDLVSTGDVAFRIDDTSAYYVDLAVSEVDIAKVQVGQPATVTFDAISGKTYTGKVVQTGQVGSTSNGVVNFTVTVQITDADASVKVGMTATADIQTSSVQNVLVVPDQAVKTLGTQKVVYVLNAGVVQPIGVQIGISSDSLVEVSSSQLKVGDLIVLNPSTTAQTSNVVKAN